MCTQLQQSGLLDALPDVIAAAATELHTSMVRPAGQTAGLQQQPLRLFATGAMQLFSSEKRWSLEFSSDSPAWRRHGPCAAPLAELALLSFQHISGCLQDMRLGQGELPDTRTADWFQNAVYAVEWVANAAPAVLDTDPASSSSSSSSTAQQLPSSSVQRGSMLCWHVSPYTWRLV
jgi:hypothetical protein